MASVQEVAVKVRRLVDVEVECQRRRNEANPVLAAKRRQQAAADGLVSVVDDPCAPRTVELRCSDLAVLCDFVLGAPVSLVDEDQLSFDDLTQGENHGQ